MSSQLQSALCSMPAVAQHGVQQGDAALALSDQALPLPHRLTQEKRGAWMYAGAKQWRNETP